LRGGQGHLVPVAPCPLAPAVLGAASGALAIAAANGDFKDW